MARNEADHEDLMRDAVSLVKRIEFRHPSRSEPSLVGFNALGWLFVYLGTDPMYRFDEQGRLRRAFVDGRLLRTEGDTLATMERQRNSEGDPKVARSTLLRRDLSPSELDAFRARMRRDLVELSEGLVSAAILRQHPADMPQLLDELQSGLRRVLESPEFLAPALVRR